MEKNNGGILIKRIGGDKDTNIPPTDRVEIEYNGGKYVITPEFDTLRIHQSGFADGLIINPSCANEILIR